MVKKIAFFILALVIAVPYAQAADDDTALKAARELVTQTKTFQEETKSLTPGLGEKPEVSVQKETAEEAPEETGPSFLIKKIKIEGNTVFGNKKFAPPG